jgi:uncharacterized membrane protein
MGKGRLEAFSDGVLAIVITLMVLELRVPPGSDLATLRQVLPAFLGYVLSFAYLAIYWNNHHHMLHVTKGVDGRVLWANMHLLFWLSLVPAVTGWMGQNPRASLPTALYGLVLLLAGEAYGILQSTIVRREGPQSALAKAVGRDAKGRVSKLLYVAAVGLAFVRPWISQLVFVTVAIIWMVPDPRIEKGVGTST